MIKLLSSPKSTVSNIFKKILSVLLYFLSLILQKLDVGFQLQPCESLVGSVTRIHSSFFDQQIFLTVLKNSNLTLFNF